MCVLKPFWVIVAIVLTAPRATAEIQLPNIRKDTLYLSGSIDSHIYDWLAYQKEDLRRVNKVSLDSLGGDVNWALEISKFLRPLNLTTIVETGKACASSCVYIFASGVTRIMESGSLLGFHGVRPASHLLQTFDQFCSDTEKQNTIAEYRKIKTEPDDCQSNLDYWYTRAYDKTVEGFDLLERHGISEEFRTYYNSLSDVDNWHESLNILRKPDLVMSAKDAEHFGFVTIPPQHDSQYWYLVISSAVEYGQIPSVESIEALYGALKAEGKTIADLEDPKLTEDQIESLYLEALRFSANTIFSNIRTELSKNSLNSFALACQFAHLFLQMLDRHQVDLHHFELSSQVYEVVALQIQLNCVGGQNLSRYCS